MAAAVVAPAALIGVKAATGGGPAGPPRSPLTPAAASTITGVPMSALTQAASDVTGLQPALSADGTPLASAGKPEVLYVGAEFCPVCAAERWPLTVALSQFGTFSRLSRTHSASQDGDIPTLSFYGSTYNSPYLSFAPVETTTNQLAGDHYRKLETPAPDQLAAWQGVQGTNLTYPFIDIGGQWVLQTAQYPVRVLQGRSFEDVLASIGRNSTTTGAAVDASAAVLVKYLCSVTGQQPASTCAAVAGLQTGTAGKQGPSSPAG